MKLRSDQPHRSHTSICRPIVYSFEIMLIVNANRACIGRYSVNSTIDFTEYEDFAIALLGEL